METIWGVRVGRAGVRVVAALALAGVLAVGLAAAPAKAAETHLFEETFGSLTKPSFSTAASIAVDSEGRLLVVDRGANTLSRFNPNGTPADFAALGTNVIDGVEGADQVAVDNSGGLNDGNIYLTQGGSPRLIDIFSADGEHLGQLTEALSLFEEQVIEFTGFAGGDTFTLTCDGKATASIAYASGSTTRGNRVKEALEAKCGANFAVTGSGSSTTVSFQGKYAETNVAQMVCTKESGGGSCKVTTTVEGNTFEPFSQACGVAVDEAGAVYVGDSGNGIHKYAPSANPPVNADNVANFPSNTGAINRPCNLAAGTGPTAGFLFAHVPGRVTKLDSSSGAFEYNFLPGEVTVAVEPGSGHVYGADSSGSLLEFDASGAVAPVEPIAKFAEGKSVQGIAVGGLGGDVYVSRQDNPEIEVYGPLVNVAEVITEPPTDVAKTSATLNGTVNPDGVVLTECLFQYVEAAGYEPSAKDPYAAGQTVPCDPSAAEIPADTSDHAVKADLEGLTLGAEYHYRLLAANVLPNSTNVGEDQSFKLESPPVIVAAWTVETIATEAEVAALIDPEGFASSYRFEYTDEASFAAEGFKGAAKAPIPDGGIPVFVSGKADLTAGEATLKNLTTSAGAFAPGQGISGTGIPTGTTILAVDRVHRTLVLSQAATSGDKTNREITATGAQPVVVPLNGLKPATAYRWRVVATNLIGEEESAPRVGPVRTFTTHPSPVVGTGACANEAYRTGAGALLPNCRAYEMVSPVDKDGADIVSFTDSSGTPVARNQSAPDGDKITYTAEQRFCDGISRPYAPQYIATRRERGEPGEGWSCHGISPPRGVRFGGPVEGSQNEFQAFSENLCRAWLRSNLTTGAPLAPGGVAGARNFYERSNCGVEGYRTLSDDGGVLHAIAANGAVVYGLGSDLAYERGGVKKPICILPDETSPGSCSAKPFAELGALADDGSRVYWTSGTGAIYLRENPAQPQSELKYGAATGRGDLSKGSTEVSNVSAETGGFEVGQTIAAGRGIKPGTTVVAVGAGTLTLSAPADETRSSERLSAYSECTQPDKACTVVVSEGAPSSGPIESTTGQATFLGAAADGAAALFSFDPDNKPTVVEPAKDDLFRFDADSDTYLSIAHNVLGVLGASRNLSRVYLVSEETIAGAGENSEEAKAIAGEPNLYLYRAEGGGSFSFIATLAEEDVDNNTGYFNPSPVSTIAEGHNGRVSPDGQTAAFVSYASPTDYDNTDARSGEADAEVFRFDATARGGKGVLACVSCNPSGARPRGQTLERGFNIVFWAAQLAPGQHPLYFPRALSNDGRRIYFDSFDRLLLRDTNGKQDVYQWEAAGKGDCDTASATYDAKTGGCLSLISSGKHPTDAAFVDATPDGSDIFFTTAESLYAADPALIDLYDAREGGGFPPPPSTEPPCEGEACQSPPAPPQARTWSSSAFHGPGDLRRRCGGAAKRAAKLSRRAKQARKRARKQGGKGAKRMRRRAAELNRRARAQHRKAKRCRRAARRARR